MRRMRLFFSSLSLFIPFTASATTFTLTSPAGGALPQGVSAVGGVVVDLIGANGVRVVSQLAASKEYVGQPPASSYPLLFGTQGGFTSDIVAALGGGMSSAAFRITLYDGDNQAGNFDYHDNNLLVNGLDFGDFSNVATQQTDGKGVTVYSSGFGFGNNILDTGFFTSNDSTLLAALFSTLGSGNMEFRVKDRDPGDQYYDFTQGIDSSLLDVGQGPTVAGAVPEPSSLTLLGTGALGAAGVLRQRLSRTRA